MRNKYGWWNYACGGLKVCLFFVSLAYVSLYIFLLATEQYIKYYINFYLSSPIIKNLCDLFWFISTPSPVFTSLGQLASSNTQDNTVSATGNTISGTSFHQPQRNMLCLGGCKRKVGVGKSVPPGMSWKTFETPPTYENFHLPYVT